MALKEEDVKIGSLVSDFYNESPFPGYDINKFIIKDDLYKNANIYSRLLHDQIPYGKSILDAGCGTGQLACLLSLKGRTVVGMDFTEKSLAKAKELKAKLKLDSASFRQANLLELKDTGERFDYIFCNGVLHHTNNPYLGFSNLMQFSKKGTLVVIGLYNKYGRMFLRLKRTWVNWRYVNDQQKKREAIQDMLVKDEEDCEKQDSWFDDQYSHPHELSHSIDELLGWYEKNQVEYVNSIPPIELFRKEGNAKMIFKKSPVNGWKNSRSAHILKQLGWIISLRETGGYYLIVGRKT